METKQIIKKAQELQQYIENLNELITNGTVDKHGNRTFAPMAGWRNELAKASSELNEVKATLGMSVSGLKILCSEEQSGDVQSLSSENTVYHKVDVAAILSGFVEPVIPYALNNKSIGVDEFLAVSTTANDAAFALGISTAPFNATSVSFPVETKESAVQLILQNVPMLSTMVAVLAKSKVFELLAKTPIEYDSVFVLDGVNSQVFEQIKVVFAGSEIQLVQKEKPTQTTNKNKKKSEEETKSNSKSKE